MSFRNPDRITVIVETGDQVEVCVITKPRHAEIKVNYPDLLWLPANLFDIRVPSFRWSDNPTVSMEVDTGYDGFTLHGRESVASLVRHLVENKEPAAGHPGTDPTL